MHPLVIRVSALLFLVTSLVGCGSGGRPEIPTVPVSGTVTLDGKPLSGATVNFVTDEYAGVATTDASGKFSMTAQAGQNKIFITKFDSSDPNFDETMIGTGVDTAGAGPKQLVPKKFSDPEATELQFSVPDSGATDANFELTSR